MRTEHSLKVALMPYPDGSYIIEFSYWLPVDDGRFELRGGRTIAPNPEGVLKVVGTLLPYATYKYKPKTDEDLWA
jgi:hypothetical protein